MAQSPPTLTRADAEILDQVIQDVARRYRLRPPDAQDFTQTVHVRLLERGYDVFQRFEGRCSKRGYLSVAVKRMALDWLNIHCGKWRPSTAAQRLGPVAVTLDRLIHRDGYSPAVAISSQAAQAGSEPEDLHRMVAQLPVRVRRRVVAIEVLEHECHLDFDDPVLRAEQRAAAHFISHTLGQLVQELPHEERHLLTLRYRQQQTVPVIAEQMGVDAKRLYRRFDRTLQVLRQKLVTQGVTGPAQCSPAAR